MSFIPFKKFCFVAPLYFPAPARSNPILQLAQLFFGSSIYRYYDIPDIFLSFPLVDVSQLPSPHQFFPSARSIHPLHLYFAFLPVTFLLFHCLTVRYLHQLNCLFPRSSFRSRRYFSVTVFPTCSHRFPRCRQRPSLLLRFAFSIANIESRYPVYNRSYSLSGITRRLEFPSILSRDRERPARRTTSRPPGAFKAIETGNNSSTSFPSLSRATDRLQAKDKFFFRAQLNRHHGGVPRECLK